MARITEEALDATERGKLRLRSAVASSSRRPSVNVAPTAPLVSLALIVGGAGTLAARVDVPFTAVLLAIAAVAVGGWLARGPGEGSPESRQAVARERAELNRVLVALALRGSDGRAGSSDSRQQGPPRVEHGEDGDVHPPAGRGALHAVSGGGGESLEPDADAELAGGFE